MWLDQGDRFQLISGSVSAGEQSSGHGYIGEVYDGNFLHVLPAFALGHLGKFCHPSEFHLGKALPLP